MISQALVDFLHGPVVAAIGTRGDGLMPAVCFARGIVVDAENDTVTVIIPDVESETTLENLARNGVIAFTAGDGISHETYQFKGTCLDVAPSDAHQQVVGDVYTKKMVAHYRKKGVPDEYFGGYILTPSTAIRFRVEAVFVQTPGPGAGREIDLATGEPAT